MVSLVLAASALAARADIARRDRYNGRDASTNATITGSVDCLPVDSPFGVLSTNETVTTTR